MTSIELDPASIEFRRTIFAPLFDFTQGHGLEIGPLAAPIAERGPCDVDYVDVIDRDGLVAHYSHEPTIDTDLIPELQYWLQDGDRFRTLSEAVAPGAPYDWVMASHVIEHVPDVVGWLSEISTVLRDGGKLVLAVPDRRFTFDIFRPATTTGQALQAHEAREATPSVRAVFDHFRNAATVHPTEAWNGEKPGADALMFTLEQALAWVDKQRAGEYIDSHVWTFTPRELVGLLDDLGRLGLVELTVAHLVPTRRINHEFYAVLERLPRDVPPQEREALRVAGLEAALAGCPPEDVPTAADDSPRAEVLAREDALVSAVAALESTVAGLEAEVHDLRTDYHAVKTSTRWRVGGLVVTPATRLRSVVAGRRR